MNSLDPDELPSRLVRDPSDARSTVAFTGYLGESSAAEHVRFYLDEEMRDWFDVAATDVLHHERCDSRSVGRTILWVDQRATLQRRQHQPDDAQAEYLEGELAQATVPQSAMNVLLDVTAYIRHSPYKYHPTHTYRPPDIQ